MSGVLNLTGVARPGTMRSGCLASASAHVIGASSSPRGRHGAMQFERFLTLLRALQQEGVEYVLVGGVAMNLHGIARATEDVDLFIRPERENVQRLTRALRSIWEDPDIDQITVEDLRGEYPTVRYGPPGEDFVIDLLSRLGEQVQFEDIEAERLRLGDAEVRIATPRMLYRMKKDTVRPIDRADATALREKFALPEE